VENMTPNQQFADLRFEQLLAVDWSLRDEAWEKAFLAELPQAQVRVLNPEAQSGPDGWPYLFVGDVPPPNTPENKPEPAAEAEPLLQVLNWLSSRGIGLALNPQKSSPDFVLTYGMVWNFRERGQFVSEIGQAPRSSAIEVSAGQQVMTAQPSESFLPAYVRSILKQFLADQGLFAPKIMMISFDQKNYELCFSLESLKSPPPEEQAGIAEALAWFLPAHYVVSLVSEKAVPGFVAL
jgi:hypothetical protein